MIEKDDLIKWIEESKDKDKWIHCTTLGGKAKSFYWKVDDSLNLHIIRKFSSRKDITKTTLSFHELAHLDSYMQNSGWTCLANSVTNLQYGIEKDGIGKFLVASLNFKPESAQVASQLAAIFTLVGAWDYNGRKARMQFKKNNTDWKERLHNYYTTSLSNML